jgi:uncharacterized protein YycO
MKKSLFCLLIGGLVVGVHTPLYAAPTEMNSYVNEIVHMQPGSTPQEVLQDAKYVAKLQHKDVEEVLQEIHKELAADVKKGQEEKSRHLQGGKGKKRWLVKSVKGNIFYSDSETGTINHGHVGIYYKEDLIVESMPKLGVRKLEAKQKEVSPGAVIKSVNTSDKKRGAAADWAFSRIGKDGYSNNFATNRLTDHYGNKNCSKLVWSSFILKAGLDVDKDGGTGVYPRDIRDSSLTKIVKTIP